MRGGESHVRVSTRPGKVAINAGDAIRARLKGHRSLVQRALRLIEEAVSYGCIGIAYSGGKDSTVVLDLVRRVVPDAPVAFFDSGAELQSTYDLMVQYQVPSVHPQRSLIEMCQYGGYWGHPDPVDPDATFNFKEILIFEPARRWATESSLSVIAMGLRADESVKRRLNARTKGALYHADYDGLWHVCPLQTWTVEDVWAYIADRALPYNRAYDTLTACGVPRPQQRVSTLLGVDAASRGRYVYLKQLDSDLWNRLAADFPKIRSYT